MRTPKQGFLQATVRVTIVGVVAAVLSASTAAQRTVSAPAADAATNLSARSSTWVLGPVLVLGDGRGTPYILDRSDNICGLDEPRAISKPAKVDFTALLDATPEVRRLKRKRIRRDSAQGMQIMADARRRVLAVCQALCASEGHCSVWKKIRRRDRRAVPDLTAKAKAALAS